MKYFGILTLALTASLPALAGFPPSTTCSNYQNTVEIGAENVTYRSPEKSSISSEIPLDSLNLSETVIAELPEVSSGCTSRKIVIKNIRLTKKSGEPMPSAYNRNQTAKGAFDDVFICATTSAWMSSSCPPVIE